MILVVIPAKEKSGRLPNKNMISIFGRPLIYYTIDYAKKSLLVDKIVVSTESKKIINYAKKQKIGFIKRPKDLCGETPIIEVYRHAYHLLKKKYKIKFIIGLQPDHPDREINLDWTISFFKKKKLDFLYSKDKENNKNGAHYIVGKRFLQNRPVIKKAFIVDNCTNIHFLSDLKSAKENLRLINK
jgi:CMP-N,N'-diacetyllegionaminic acid synthase